MNYLLYICMPICCMILVNKDNNNVEGTVNNFVIKKKRHYTETKIIQKLILDDNTEITDQEFILQQQKCFHENLYDIEMHTYMLRPCLMMKIHLFQY